MLLLGLQGFFLLLRARGSLKVFAGSDGCRESFPSLSFPRLNLGEEWKWKKKRREWNLREASSLFTIFVLEAGLFFFADRRVGPTWESKECSFPTVLFGLVREELLWRKKKKGGGEEERKGFFSF